MIKDTNYFLRHQTTILDSEFLREQNVNNFVDNLGIKYNNEEHYNNYCEKYFQRKFNNARQDFKTKQFYLESSQKILNFNSNYSVNDLVKGHFQITQNIKPIADNALLYMGTHSLNLINTKNGKQKKLYDIQHPESLTTSKELMLVSGVVKSYNIFLYDIKKNQCLLNKRIHSKDIANYTKFIESEDELLLCWNSPEIGIFDLNTFKVKQLLKIREGANHFDILPEKQICISAQDHKNIQLSDMRGWKETIDFKGHTQNNFAITFLSDNFFASGGEDSTTRIWDIRQPNQEYLLLKGQGYQIGDLIYDDKKKLLHVLETAQFFYTFDLASQIPVISSQKTIAYFQGFCLNNNKDKMFVASYHDHHKQSIQEFDIKKSNQFCLVLTLLILFCI